MEFQVMDGKCKQCKHESIAKMGLIWKSKQVNSSTLYFPYRFLEILTGNGEESLFTFSARFSVRLQHKMHYRGAFHPPVAHHMLQTNRKRVQKK
jgi:hypothetical protein